MVGGIPTLDGEGGIYLGWGRQGVFTLDGGGRGYLPWMGRGTYLGWGGGVPTLDRGGGGTYLGKVMPRAVRLLQLAAGGLSCCFCHCNIGTILGIKTLEMKYTFQVILRPENCGIGKA